MNRIKLFLILALILAACNFAAGNTQPDAQIQKPDEVLPVVEASSRSTPEEEEAVLPVVQLAATLTPTIEIAATMPGSAPVTQPTATTAAPVQEPKQASQAVGPDKFPEGYNPLTGLPVKDPSFLKLPPALISVTNFPVTARPQAGLSFSPYVFEMSIGEGMTRFLAMFYGSFPEKTIQGKSSGNLPSDDAVVGPIRSGRLSYESIRKLYTGFMIMAGAYSEVGAVINDSTNIFGSDESDINSALIDVTRLQSLAEANAKKGKKFNLTGNLFDPAAPSGGSSANRLWVFYSFLNQVRWDYDAATGKYLRFQDEADGSGTFVPASDRLTGQQLAFSNVIVLFSQSHYLNTEKTLIDMDLLYTGNEAMLFRDGQAYPIRWNTENGEYEKTTGLMRPFRFTDASGKPVALKPGNTWVEMVDVSTLLEQIEPGYWKARFFNP